jgi:ABC-type transport system involved in multi-copper enzyme maturation permease subunit
MNNLRILYHMARADFLERTRRYSFLILLALVLYLGYTVNAGQIVLRLDTYRGIFNSAWTGSMMSLVINFFLGWFGFYLIKNSIARDYETGVGQIMATTPLTRPLYALGKWLSNFSVLGVMVFILMLAAGVMQLLQREDPRLDLWALFAPFLFVSLPFMALTAAIAVLFESIRWLRGGLGNVVYFFFFLTCLSLVTITLGAKTPLLDWVGFGILSQSMGDAARAVYPAYQNGFSLGLVPPANIETFYWPGVAWTIPVILSRLAAPMAAFGIVLLGALFFDRFDPSHARPRQVRQLPASAQEPAGQEPAGQEPDPVATPAAVIQLTPLSQTPSRSQFRALLKAELAMLLKGYGWWWYAAAAGLVIAPLFTPLDVARLGLLPAAMIWPILVWSGLGCRESRFHTGPMVFSTPHPLERQLPAAWLSGFGVALAAGSGVALKLALAGDTGGLLPLLAGMLLIPSLALALGVWTGSHKVFEIIYLLMWYAGPINKLAALDYLGVWSRDAWPYFLAASAALAVLAILGRQVQLHRR